MPFATVNSAITWRIAKGCIVIAYLNIALLSCPKTQLEQFYCDSAMHPAPARRISRLTSHIKCFCKQRAPRYAAISTIRCAISTDVAERFRALDGEQRRGAKLTVAGLTTTPLIVFAPLPKGSAQADPVGAATTLWSPQSSRCIGRAAGRHRSRCGCPQAPLRVSAGDI